MFLEANANIKYARIDASAAGETIVVPGASGKIRILSLCLMAAAPVEAEFRSNSDAITGPLPLAANQPLQSANTWGVIATESGEDLRLNLSSAVQVSGWLSYQN